MIIPFWYFSTKNIGQYCHIGKLDHIDHIKFNVIICNHEEHIDHIDQIILILRDCMVGLDLEEKVKVNISFLFIRTICLEHLRCSSVLKYRKRINRTEEGPINIGDDCVFKPEAYFLEFSVKITAFGTNVRHAVFCIHSD